ncbi:carboxymuconolactone decarboxylase family protein [Methanonatronarchaeum sp. AMET6-2]|uniref:carboxymuconolactone decarboxylase family protein n=1 Tax=Methanonatronarchaeum sp. AMET6-2 TaxID=2933293 RepID=UPI001FF69316|nr:carboxymuconolactone decarboxylase family protein [Methanonatronarchaeum sp. AMET6-2]UOY09909.1 carboxymuconolactone decarboxylase family protein [Methanonatronarchaeum sp. AMET6-2]
MSLSEKEKELVAIGASIGSNCVPCIKHHVKKARELGLQTEKIERAIKISKRIKQVSNGKVSEAALEQLKKDER